MKWTVAFGILILGAATLRAEEAWKGYNQGIRWEKSLEAAKQRAAKEGKPILLHQLVGDLDKEGC
jgi:hypothetical protein